MEGVELEQHMEREAVRLAGLEKDADAIDLSDISDSDEEIEEVGTLGAPVYDIYVKDHVSRKGFFKQSQSFRMYPVIEARTRVDEYGEMLDLAAFSKFEQKVPEDYVR